MLYQIYEFKESKLQVVGKEPNFTIEYLQDLQLPAKPDTNDQLTIENKIYQVIKTQFVKKGIKPVTMQLIVLFAGEEKAG